MKKIIFLLSISLISACGLQVRDNPTTTTGNPNTNGGNPDSVVFTVGGHASGIPMRKDVVLSINGHNYTIAANGPFTFPQHFENNDHYDVDIETDLDGAYTCSLQNDSGSIPNANVTNVLLTCSCHDGSLGVGTGTSGNPILVYTSTQLNNFALTETVSTLSKYYKQVCDLDYSGMDPAPIGTPGASFTGTYDGNGYFILNYTSDQNAATKTRRKGLFSWTNGAHLKNINLFDFALTANIGQGNGTNPARMGALAGTAINTKIENIYAEDISIDDNGQVFHGLGGLVGEQQVPTCATSYLKNVHVEDVTIHGDDSENVGGVVGWTQTDSTNVEVNDVSITGCTNRCGGFSGNTESNAELKDVNVQDASILGDQHVGGITGENNGLLDRTAFVGTVNGLTTVGGVGGLVGYSTCNQPIKNSYTSSDILSVGGSSNIGRVYGNQASITNVAFDNSQTCQNCSANPGTTSLANSDTFQLATAAAMSTWDFTNVWCAADSTFPHLVGVPFSRCE